MTLFGWDIHAPGIMSERFYEKRELINERIGLYVTEESRQYVSTNRGGKLADPQIYHIGEAFEPMSIEAFSVSCNEFVYLDVEPTNAILQQYAISDLVVIDITGFDNRVTIKGQAVALKTEVFIFDQSLSLWAHFESEGSSDAQRVFAKRGGPEVNMNAAIENNLTVTIQFINDLFTSPEKVAT